MDSSIRVAIEDAREQGVLQRRISDFCRKNDVELVELAVGDFEANGIAERANRTLRIFFRCLFSEKEKCCLSQIVVKARYAKNIWKGSTLKSSFQLMYSQHPRVMNDFYIFKLPAISIVDHVMNVTRKRLGRLVHLVGFYGTHRETRFISEFNVTPLHLSPMLVCTWPKYSC